MNDHYPLRFGDNYSVREAEQMAGQMWPKCVCGYQSEGEADLDQHILAVMHVFDGQDHAPAH